MEGKKDRELFNVVVGLAWDKSGRSQKGIQQVDCKANTHKRRRIFIHIMGLCENFLSPHKYKHIAPKMPRSKKTLKSA